MISVSLLADIGGTNARFALAGSKEGVLKHVRFLSAVEYPSIEGAIDHYLAEVGVKPARACFAVACPPDEETIQFTNSPWRFSPRRIQESYSLSGLHMVNDFEALASGIGFLPKDRMIELKPGQDFPTGQRGVIGPGTGLGVSGMVHHQGDWVVIAGEGGHTGFAPQDDVEFELLRYAQRVFGRVSNERLLQGEGIVTIYQFFCMKADKDPVLKSPADISASNDPVALETISRYVSILGSVAGDLALTMGARGGIFIGGGIAPKMIDRIRESAFVERFCAKGRLSRLLKEIPVYVITDQHAALYGAADILRRRKDS